MMREPIVKSKKPPFDIRAMLYKRSLRTLNEEGEKIALQWKCEVSDLKMEIRKKDEKPYITIRSLDYYTDVTDKFDNPIGDYYFKQLLKYAEIWAGIWKIEPSKVHLQLILMEEKPEVVVVNEVTEEIRKV